MTADEIIERTEESGFGPHEREGKVALPLIGDTVDLFLMGPDDPPHVTPEMAGALTAMMALGPDRLPELRALVASDARDRGRDLAYDLHMALPEAERARRPMWTMLGLADDGSAPDDWPVLDWVNDLRVYGFEQPARCVLRFTPPWEEEHGLGVELVNGRLDPSYG